MTQQPFNFGTAAANDGESLRSAFTKIGNMLGVVGLTADDSSSAVKTANTAAIQAAIDAAYATGGTLIQLPPGIYYCDLGIYLDAPGNIRSTPAVPTIFDFSLELRGEGGIGNHEDFGTQLRFTANTGPALIVGTGQGMKVSSLSVLGPDGATSRAAMNTSGIGIALGGGNAGLSRCLIEHCMVENFYIGVQSGYNANNLSDSVTLRKCYVANCYIGFNPAQTQNYINTLDDCTFGDCTFHVKSTNGKAVNVIGGNYSTTSVNNKRLTIGSVSTLTSFTDTLLGSNFTNWTFTATLSAASQPMTDGAFDSFCLSTSGFGLIPLSLVSYVSATRVATLKFYPGWLNSHYHTFDLKANSDIQTEIQGQTTLYASERIFVFSGGGITATGVHIESPGALSTVLDDRGDVTGDRVSRLDRCFFNYNIDQNEYNVPATDNLAAFYCQQVFPFIRQTQRSGIVLSDCGFNGANCTEGINIEIYNHAQNRFIVRNCDLPPPNITVPLNTLIHPADGVSWQSMGHGAGEWDSTPFLPREASDGEFYTAVRISGAPFIGWKPSPATVPRLTPTQLASITSGPGSLGAYPPLHGETIYSVIDYDSGALVAIWARSAHSFFSYGQNLTIDWSYKGQSNVVALDNTERMFAGLKITLDNGGGDDSYIVTGVYPALGYITVLNELNATNPNAFLDGTKTTTYTDATVKQQAYSITRYPNFSSPVLTTPQINDTSADHQYVVAVSELAADRTVTLPLLGAADEFVFKDHAVALANKTLTAPKLVDGGFIADANGNELIKGATTASAVNEITATNAATGNNPSLSATGDNTNIGLSLLGKGTGGVIVGGTSTNDSAAAGKVGEIIQSTVLVGAPVGLSTATPADVTSISLTAGDWDVWGSVWFTPAATTSVTIFQGAVNTTSATLPTAPAGGAYFKKMQAALVPNAVFGSPVGTTRISVASTTTVYLVTQATFTADALSAYGYIGARRVR